MQAFSNVAVHCMGLWDKEDVAVDLEMGGDGKPWAWRLKEVPADTKGAVKTTSVPALLKQHGLHALDLAKIGTPPPPTFWEMSFESGLVYQVKVGARQKT